MERTVVEFELGYPIYHSEPLAIASTERPENEEKYLVKKEREY